MAKAGMRCWLQVFVPMATVSMVILLLANQENEVTEFSSNEIQALHGNAVMMPVKQRNPVKLREDTDHLNDRKTEQHNIVNARNADNHMTIEKKETRLNLGVNVTEASALKLVPQFIIENNLETVYDTAITKPVEQEVRDCDDDCPHLQKLLQSWPSSKPTAAFYFLTQAARLPKLNYSLRLIDEHFNDKYHYPVIIFHESDLIPHKEEIRTYTRSAVFFQLVTLTQPRFLTKEVNFYIPCLSTIGYRKMCRFHAKDVYEYPIVQNLDYLFRLDDDSFITRPIHYDVFEYMRDNKLMYGYIWSHYDAMSCTEGLWEATSRYINVTGIQPQFFDEWSRPKLYYNNFEISKISIWLSKEYTQYVNYLDKLGGMFYHRWGDAPIKSLAVSMFVKKNQTHLFKDIGYEHTSFTN